MAQKSIDQRMYEAFQKGKGLTLSASELDEYVLSDSAVPRRICMRAWLETTLPDEALPTCDGLVRDGSTWAQFKDDLVRSYEQGESTTHGQD